MIRHILLIITYWVLVNSLVIPQELPEELTANSSMGTATIDGIIVCDFCGGSNFKGLNKSGISDSEDDISGVWYSQWDETSLYIAVDIKDDFYDWAEEFFNIDNSRIDFNTWAYDCIEIFVNPTGQRNLEDSSYETANASQIRFNPLDGTEVYNTSGGGFVKDHLNELIWLSEEVPNGYILEAIIPWSAILPDPTSIPNQIGFTINIIDSDDYGGNREAVLMWVGADMEDLQWNNINYFGVLYLSSDINSCYFPGCNSSIDDEDYLNEINYILFPNPATDYILINTAIKGKFNIEIYDILGRKLLSKFCMNDEEINISSLNKGSYIVKINNGNKLYSQLFNKY